MVKNVIFFFFQFSENFLKDRQCPACALSEVCPQLKNITVCDTQLSHGLLTCPWPGGAPLPTSLCCSGLPLPICQFSTAFQGYRLDRAGIA